MNPSQPRRSSLFQLLRQQLRSFRGPRTVELPVSAYGKLPIYKDFLRHGLAGAEAQALKKWLDRGISKYWAANEAYRDSEIRPHAFLLGFPATGRQVLGYLWGSHDQGGLRRFPFVLFVSLPASSAAAGLDALGQVAEQGAALRGKLATLPDLDAFRPLIRTATLTLTLRSDREVRERLAAAEAPTVGELGASFFGTEAETRWPALLAHLRRRRDSEVAVNARLPSSDAVPAARLVVLWCLLLEGARKSSRTPLQVLFATEEPDAGITLLHRDLRSDDIFALHPEMPDYEYITDLRRLDLAGNPAPPLTEAQEARPLAALLDKDCHRP